MYITPNSTLKLLARVPIDNKYKHTLYFADRVSQQAYFSGKSKRVFENYTYLKEQRKIKVGEKADNLYDCNYLMFRNTSFGTKWFYAFITKVEYISNDCSEISFEIDVMQTWLVNYDYDIKPSFVEREHSVTDKIGTNLVPENVDIGDYTYEDLGLTSLFDLNQIVVVATFDKQFEPAVGGWYGGVYSGLCYNVFSSATLASEFLKQATIDNKSDGIVSIFMLPIAFCSDYQDTLPEVFNIERDKNYDNIDGYVPKNNKLFTAPYNLLYVTNNEGISANYKFEYFSTDKCQFNVSGVMCATPECMLVPSNYKTVEKNYNEKLVIGNFPQCAYTIDAFRAYIAQNAHRLLSDVSGGATKAIGGAGIMYATKGMLGGKQVVDGLGQVKNTIITLQDKETLPPHARGYSSSMINTANKIKGFQFYYAHIRKEFAEIIDNFFSVYGYATHKVKVPNINSRPRWNYVKTIEVCLTGSVPADDMEVIQQVYNNGVTFWKNGNDVGNYDLPNQADASHSSGGGGF